MRILTAHYGLHRGGSERALHRLVEMWAALGHEVRCLEEPGGHSATLARALQAETRTFSPDILFAGGQTYAPPFALARLDARLRQRPFVMKLSNAPLHPGRQVTANLSRTWLRLQQRWTDCFVAPDAPSAALLRAIGVADGKLAVIANPVASENRLQSLHDAGANADPDPALRLLTIGRLAPQKNMALLIEAFARIARQGDYLTIIGDGPLREKLAGQAARHAADIRFTGHLPDPGPYFAQSNAFALASDFEGLPAVLVETLAAGLPIAATDSAPGIADLLAGHGAVVPPRNVEALARAIENLRGFRAARGAMLERARVFTAERSAPDYIELFRGLAKG